MSAIFVFSEEKSDHFAEDFHRRSYDVTSVSQMETSDDQSSHTKATWRSTRNTFYYRYAHAYIRTHLIYILPYLANFRNLRYRIKWNSQQKLPSSFRKFWGSLPSLFFFPEIWKFRIFSCSTRHFTSPRRLTEIVADNAVLFCRQRG